MRKSSYDSIACYKFKDCDYNNCSHDSDCDSVSEGAFGNVRGVFFGLGKNNAFRDVERVTSN
jgi:hypothetical protein